MKKRDGSRRGDIVTVECGGCGKPVEIKAGVYRQRVKGAKDGRIKCSRICAVAVRYGKQPDEIRPGAIPRQMDRADHRSMNDWRFLETLSANRAKKRLEEQRKAAQ